MADERDPRNRYRRSNEEVEEEQEDEAYEEVEEGGKGALTGFLILFIILFVLSTGLLVYFQFYQGNGEWKLTFKHKNIKEQPVEKLQNQNEKLSKKVENLQGKLSQKESELAEAKQKEQGSRKGGADISGTYYEVQIGAFKSFSFDRYGDNVTNLVFNTEDGMKKLTVGQFKEANAARAFRRDLARLGVEDAFIVEKKNGKRVEIIESF